jgi:hypothetical protein
VYFPNLTKVANSNLHVEGTESVETICITNKFINGSKGFREWSSLKDLYYEGSLTELLNMTYVSAGELHPLRMSSLENLYLLDEAGQKKFLNKNYSLLEEDLVIPEGIVTYNANILYGYSKLKSIHFPSTLTDISAGGLAGCPGLQSVTIDQNNLVLDSRDNCNAIIKTATNTLVTGCAASTVPEGTKSVGIAAFRHCKGLTTIVLPETVTSLKDYAFQDCSNLISVNFPSKVTNIGAYCFEGTALTEVNLSSIVTNFYLDNSVFANTPITDLYIPSNCQMVT